MTDNDAPENTTEPAEPSTPGGDQAVDHHSWVVYLGVLALILLFIGAVGVSAQNGNGARDASTELGGDGQGTNETKAERRAQREAEKQQRAAERQERKAAKQERQSGRMAGQGSEGSGDETTAPTQQTGTLTTATTADGETAYVLETATGALVLDAGPPHFWGTDHPLAPLVGQTVTVTGRLDPETDHLAVWTVDDLVIRGPGRPPWAGGSKAPGQRAPTTSPLPSSSVPPSTAP